MHGVVPPSRRVAERDRPDWLLTRWRSASVAAGWPVVADWYLPETADVAEAILSEEDPIPALTRLGASRASIGADLSGTLRDVTALYSVVRRDVGTALSSDADQAPGRWLTAVAVGWGDETVNQIGQLQIQDSLTGQRTPAYLRTRLDEVYQERAAAGAPAGDSYALVVVSVCFPEATRMAHLGGMILVAEALRVTFSSGETQALLTPSTAVVLTRRHPTLPVRTAMAQRLIQERVRVDPSLGSPSIRVWLERLPRTFDSACDLLREICC